MVSQVRQGLRERLGLQVKLGLLAQQDPLDHKVQSVLLALLVRLGFPVLLDHKDPLAHKDRRVSLERLG